MANSNQDLIDYQNSIKTYNLNLISDLEERIIDLENQVTVNQEQIITLNNDNNMIDQTIAFIPPDQKKQLIKHTKRK